jgi:hypothetical protein
MPRYDGASRSRMKRGNNRGGLGKKLSCSGSERAAKEFPIIDDLDEPVVPAVQGQVVTCGNYARKAQESRSEFRAIFSGTQAEQRERYINLTEYGP